MRKTTLALAMTLVALPFSAHAQVNSEPVPARLPGAAFEGWYVLMAKPEGQWGSPCMAKVVTAIHKNEATLTKNIDQKRSLSFKVTKAFGPYETAQAAQQALSNSGWLPNKFSHENLSIWDTW